MTESRENKLKKDLEWKKKKGQGHDLHLLYLNKQNKNQLM